jgi:hypothetical protein
MQIAVLFGVLSIPSFASADGGLLGSVLNQPEEIVETVTEEVANTSSQVEEALPIETDQIEPIQSVTNVVESVNNSTKKVTATVASEEPILEVNISEAPSIKVNTNVVETEVSNTPKVKVDTPIVKVEVADTVEVNTEVESEPEISVQTPVVKVESPAPSETTTEKEVIETPNVDVEIAEPPVERVKQGTNPIQVNEKVKPQSSRTLEIGEVQDEVVIGKERIDFVAAVEPKTDEPNNASSIPLPMNEPTNFEQVKVTPTFQSGPSTQQNSGATTGVATVAMLNRIDITTQSGTLSYLGKTRLFFNQWLNAPPSQPPQHSLFMISRI